MSDDELDAMVRELDELMGDDDVVSTTPRAQKNKERAGGDAKKNAGVGVLSSQLKQRGFGRGQTQNSSTTANTTAPIAPTTRRSNSESRNSVDLFGTSLSSSPDGKGASFSEQRKLEAVRRYVAGSKPVGQSLHFDPSSPVGSYVPSTSSVLGGSGFSGGGGGRGGGGGGGRGGGDELDELLRSMDCVSEKLIDSTEVDVKAVQARVCIPVMIGPQGCGKLRCRKCDFQVAAFRGHRWNKGVDQLWFRLYMGDFAKLKDNLTPAHGFTALCCQCSWISVEKPRSVDQVDGLKWVCSGHDV